MAGSRSRSTADWLRLVEDPSDLELDQLDVNFDGVDLDRLDVELSQAGACFAADEQPLAAALDAFTALTGFDLQYQALPRLGTAPAPRPELVMRPIAGRRQAPRGLAQSMATALASLWGEVLAARAQRGLRETALADMLPLLSETSGGSTASESLETTLASAAHAVGCQAAALYVLDDATRELTCRASHGVSRSALNGESRDLAEQLADLEALLGHPVVLESDELFSLWRVPTIYPNAVAAVCVPVSAKSMPLGTLWMFADERRDFTSREINLIEIVAARMATDLDRGTPTPPPSAKATHRTAVSSAANFSQAACIPNTLGRAAAFHEAVAVTPASTQLVAGMVVGSGMSLARPEPWTSPARWLDQFRDVRHGLLHATLQHSETTAQQATGMGANLVLPRVSLATSGGITGLRLSKGDYELLARLDEPPLGRVVNTRLEVLSPDELWVWFTTLGLNLKQHGSEKIHRAVWQSLVAPPRATAKQLAERTTRTLKRFRGGNPAVDSLSLVLQWSPGVSPSTEVA